VHNREVHRDTHAVFLEMDISSSDEVEVMEEDMMAQLPREGEFPATLGINSNQARDSDLQPNVQPTVLQLQFSQAATVAV